MNRDKLKNPLQLEGKTVILEEISQKYFPYVIEWRNNPDLNKYLNQPFKLTMELEKKWYEEKYLPDDTQGMLIVIDKKTATPIGTQGWGNMDFENKICTGERLILGDRNFQGAPSFLESFFTIGDYLYKFVNVMYGHVVKQNKHTLNLDIMVGWQLNKGNVQFPKNLFVNGMEQLELYRSKEMFLAAKQRIFERFKDTLFV